MEKYFCENHGEIDQKETEVSLLSRKEFSNPSENEGVHATTDGFIHKNCGGKVIKKDYI